MIVHYHSSVRVPVLTYHSMNILGNTYASNDHVALREDLCVIDAHGSRIVPLAQVVAVLEGRSGADLTGCVALTFDDGAWFDWYDLEHPTCGPQRSFANILRDFRATRPAAQPYLHATSFVIASPRARDELDRTCMVGRGWWTDQWWPKGSAEGLIAIESHSWDHNHATLAVTAQRDQHKGTFRSIDSYADADAQIRQASDYIDRICVPHRTSLFAYPYGETNEYLREEYLPRFRDEHRMQAAFATGAEPLTRTSDRWALPRYVCGHDWKTPGELLKLL